MQSNRLPVLRAYRSPIVLPKAFIGFKDLDVGDTGQFAVVLSMEKERLVDFGDGKERLLKTFKITNAELIEGLKKRV